MIAKSTRSSDLKSREWEVKQLESKQDKTIVEHVHVPEEAKRVTDRQLADAQKELQKSTAYIRSLEKSKTRLTGEAEDLARQTEWECVELRAKEKAAKAQEERAAKAIADIMKERRAKETAELASPRLHPPRLRCPSSIVLIVPLHGCSLLTAPLCRLLNWAVHLLHPPSLHIILALSLIQPNCQVMVATIGIHYSLDDLLVSFQDETND